MCLLQTYNERNNMVKFLVHCTHQSWIFTVIGHSLTRHAWKFPSLTVYPCLSLNWFLHMASKWFDSFFKIWNESSFSLYLTFRSVMNKTQGMMPFKFGVPYWKLSCSSYCFGIVYFSIATMVWRQLSNPWGRTLCWETSDYLCLLTNCAV